MRVSGGKPKTELSGLASEGILAGKIRLREDFEFSNGELDELLNEQV